MNGKTPALERLFDVRHGEARPALGAFFTLFGIIAAHTMLETARDALFLSKLPPSRLALVYVLVAVFSLVALRRAVDVARKYGRRSTIVVTLMLGAYGTVFLYFQHLTDAVVFGLYLWSAWLGTVLAAQYWLLAGQLFSISQGKRLFGPIASGGVLGAVVGAAEEAALLTRFSVRTLLLVSAGIFLATGLFLAMLVAPEHAQSHREERQRARPAMRFGDVLKQSSYVRRLSLLTVFATATLLTLDYFFKATAKASMTAAELGPFFARYYAVLNAGALVVQLVVAGPVVRRLGVIGAAALLPLFIATGGIAGLVVGGGFAVVTLTRAADGGLRHSLNRVSHELLTMPLSTELRDATRSGLESFVPRITQAAVASGLFALSMLGLDRGRLLSAIVGTLALSWLALVIGMRLPYIDVFRQALSKQTIQAGTRLPVLDANTIESILEALSSPAPARVIAAMGLLADAGRVKLIPGLVLYHESEDVLVHALRLFSKSDRRDWLSLAERLLTHPAERVRVEAVAALAKHGDGEALKRVATDASPVVRGHAAFFLARADSTVTPAQHPAVRAVLESEGEASEPGKRALLNAIQTHGDESWVDVLAEATKTEDAETMEAAALAMRRVRHARFVPLLVEKLARRDGRTAIREALVAHGPEAQSALEGALLDESTPHALRLHAPRTIALFANQRAADFLVAQLSRERFGDVRYKVLRGLGRLVVRAPVRIDQARIHVEIRKNLVEYLRLVGLRAPLVAELTARAKAQVDGPREPARAEASEALLIGLLDDKIAQALERAFRLLQMVHKRENIRGAYLALLSGDKRAHDSAREFVDALVLSAGDADGVGVRELVRLVVDDLPHEERVTRAVSAGYLEPAPTTVDEALARLVADADGSVAAIAAHHALELGLVGLRDDVGRAMEQRPDLRKFSPSAEFLPRPRVIGGAHA